jgi:hypothetical protein
MHRPKITVRRGDSSFDRDAHGIVVSAIVVLVATAASGALLLLP